MSYILEALKKAQAERQLGSAPTIHAPQPAQLVATGATPNRKHLLIGLAAGVVLASGAAYVAWRQHAASRPQVAAVVPAPAAVPPAPAAPARRQPEPVRALAAADTRPARKTEHLAAVPRAKAPAPAAAPATPAATPGAADDNVRPLAELPEAVRQQVPQVVFGGYMYSSNPADRLLLVDKVLRHEGEEVAPGLVLEKLLPKAAIMNYRGYRYRVAY
jgi:general secretion pathway protein B